MECDGDTLQRVAFLTIGQTPRSDVVPAILGHLDTAVEPFEYGALDGFSRAELEDLAPGPGDSSLVTRLSDGSEVLLSRSWTHERVKTICGEILDDRVDLIVLMSTGIFTNLRPFCATINGQRVIDRTIEALGAAGQRVGLVMPLVEQIEEVTQLSAVSGGAARAAAPPGDADALAAAAAILSDCDIIILHSVAYGEADREVLLAGSNKPIVLAQRALAGSLEAALHRLSGGAGSTGEASLAERLRLLSRREREIMLLVGDGLSNKVIGRMLHISHRTVEILRARIMDKMATESLSDLLRVVHWMVRL